MPLHLPTTSTPSALRSAECPSVPVVPIVPQAAKPTGPAPKFQLRKEKTRQFAASTCQRLLMSTRIQGTKPRDDETSELNSTLLSLTSRQGTTAAFVSTTIHSYTHSTHDDDLACTRPASPACRAASGTAREIQGPNHRCIAIAIAISITSRDDNAQEAQGPEHLRAPPGRRVRVLPSSIRSPFQSFDEFEISIESPILSLILMFVDFFF
jgi:hypothetical protein